MEMIYIAYYTVKMDLKNRRGMLRSMIFVTIIIAILGVSLNSTFKTFSFDVQTVAVYSKDDKGIEELQNFINSRSEYKSRIRLLKVNSKNEGMSDLNNEKCDEYIELLNGKIKNAYFYINDEYETSTLKSLTSSYKNSKYETGKYENIKDEPLDLQDKEPNAISYYAVTMVIMIMLYSAQGGINIVAKAMEKNMINRVRSMPIGYKKYITGSIIGKVLVLFVTSSFILLFSKFIYGANIGSSFTEVFGVILLFSIFSINFGTALLSIIRNKTVVEYALQILIPIITLVSGGYIYNEYLAESINRLSIFSPSYAAEEIMFKSIYGYNYSVKGFVLELIVLSIIFYLITIMFGEEKRL